MTRAVRRPAAARGDPRGLRPGGAGDGDIMALAFFVLMEAARSAREDLKAIMDEVKAINAAKRALRELLAKIRRDVAANSGRKNGRALDFSQGLGSERAYHRVKLPHPDPAAPGGVRFAPADLHPGRLDQLADLVSVLDDMRRKVDEMGELESLRLQMVMERMSKLMTTLSNLLKKIADTAQTITQNIK